jgi:hypothetical protein
MANGYLPVKGGSEGNATATNVPGVFLLRETWPITSIVRPLPRQARAAWRRWMPKKYLDNLK